MALTRDGLLSAVGLKVEEREHPELGTMRIRELSARQRVQWQEMVAQKKPTDETAAYFLRASLVDDDNQLLFKTMGETLKWLGDVSAEISDPIYEAILEVNGINVDEVAENFTETQSDVSDSG